jgi:hypothetical protein
MGIKKQKDTQPTVDGMSYDPDQYKIGATLEVTAEYETITKQGNIVFGCNRIPVKLVVKAGGRIDKAAGTVTVPLVLDSQRALILPGMEKRGYYGWGDYNIHDYASKVVLIDSAEDLDLTTKDMYLYPGLYACSTKGHYHNYLLRDTGEWARWYRTRENQITNSPPEPDCDLYYATHMSTIVGSRTFPGPYTPVKATVYVTAARNGLWDRARDLPTGHPDRPQRQSIFGGF